MIFKCQNVEFNASKEFLNSGIVFLDILLFKISERFIV